MYYSNRFYPRNFISREKVPGIGVERLASEAKAVDPGAFDAKVDFFDFHLHYIPPYEEFNELRRLQKEARQRTRFRANYNGFIQVDLCEWDGHQNEEYFQVSLHFFHFMLPHWYFIFVAPSSALSHAVQQHIRCAEFLQQEITLGQRITHYLVKRGVSLTETQLALALELLSDQKEADIYSVLDDYCIYLGTSPSSETFFRAYLSDKTTLAGNILRHQKKKEGNTK